MNLIFMEGWGRDDGHLGKSPSIATLHLISRLA